MEYLPSNLDILTLDLKYNKLGENDENMKWFGKVIN